MTASLSMRELPDVREAEYQTILALIHYIIMLIFVDNFD